MSPIDQFSTAIQTLCASHQVKRLYAFGSVLTDDFNEDSNIDLIVDFDTMDILAYADNYFELKFALQSVFNRPIDLLEEQALKNPYFKESISRDRKLVYEH